MSLGMTAMALLPSSEGEEGTLGSRMRFMFRIGIPLIFLLCGGITVLSTTAGAAIDGWSGALIGDWARFWVGAIAAIATLVVLTFIVMALKALRRWHLRVRR